MYHYVIMDLVCTGNKYLSKPHFICNALSSNYDLIQRDIDRKNCMRVYIWQIYIRYIQICIYMMCTVTYMCIWQISIQLDVHITMKFCKITLQKYIIYNSYIMYLEFFF